MEKYFNYYAENHNKILYLSILISSRIGLFTPSTPVTESYCKFIVSDHTISSARAFLFISDFEERKVFAFRFFKTLVRLVLAKRP